MVEVATAVWGATRHEPMTTLDAVSEAVEAALPSAAHHHIPPLALELGEVTAEADGSGCTPPPQPEALELRLSPLALASVAMLSRPIEALLLAIAMPPPTPPPTPTPPTPTPTPSCEHVLSLVQAISRADWERPLDRDGTTTLHYALRVRRATCDNRRSCCGCCDPQFNGVNTL
eukprot:SAG11_NODE_1758_length_4306_cov_2.946993_4_plen_174_part_00